MANTTEGIAAQPEVPVDLEKPPMGTEQAASQAEAPAATEQPPVGTEKAAVGELVWTHRFAGGVIADIKRRYPYYASDFLDAFRDGNGQVSLATILFLFFACISPALAFGSLFDEATEGQIGVVETIMGTAICGVMYSLLSGQPLCIMGATGPEYAYTVVFYALCTSLDIEFLPARVWQGLWSALFTVLLAVTDSCAAMSHFTRFVEDIFALLISMIFIVGAFRSLVEAFDKLDEAGAFKTVLVCVGTYAFTRWLQSLKRSRAGTPMLREIFGNFSVAISILVFSALASIWRDDVEIDWLSVSSEFRPTWNDPVTKNARSWVVNPFGMNKDFPIWAIFLMAIPALGLTVLGYLDQNLTTIIVNRPASGLKKPVGYHLDMLVCGVCIYPVCAFLGLPFPHNSTAPSLIHEMSLTKYDTVPVPGGGTRQVVSKVVEQRVTNLMIHVLIGCSLFAGSVISHVPKAVTFGIFLVMGFSSLSGNQLFERIWLWTIWDRSLYPGFRFVTKVPFQSLHKYTMIQFFCFIVLYVLTSVQQVAVVFPFFMASLVFVRKSLKRIFTEQELAELDAHEDLPPDDEFVEKSEKTVRTIDDVEKLPASITDWSRCASL